MPRIVCCSISCTAQKHYYKINIFSMTTIKKIKRMLLSFMGVYNYDRRAEQRIRKMYALYAKGGWFNKYRALRACNKIRKDYGINVYPTTKVGQNLYIAHCYGIGIGKTAIIGDNCRIFPNVHIASKNIKGGDKRRHAKIGNNCVLCINSTILGAVNIGDNVIIGANALVTKDVPSNTLVTGINQMSPLPDDLANKLNK